MMPAVRLSFMLLIVVLVLQPCAWAFGSGVKLPPHGAQVLENAVENPVVDAGVLASASDNIEVIISANDGTPASAGAGVVSSPGSNAFGPAVAGSKKFDNRAIGAKPLGRGFYSAKLSKAAVLDLASGHSVRRIWASKKYAVLLDVSVPLVAPSVFYSLGFNGSGVAVCVIDTGIDKTHGAIAGRVVKEKDFVTGDSDGDNPSDFNGHGTHVAGIIASNDSTYAGVAPGAFLFNAKVFSSTTSSASDADIMSGIDWCIAQGAQVLSLSLGGVDEGNDGGDALSQYLDLAADSGEIVAVSAGNSGPGGNAACRTSRDSTGSSYSICSPALSRKAIAVGSTQTGKSGTTADALSSFSSRGPTSDGRIKPDLSAPGQYITSAYKGGGFATLSGTSMSAPHVSGLAALMRQARPGLSPSEAKAILFNTAAHLGSLGKNNNYGAGRINASRVFLELSSSLLANASNSSTVAHVINVTASTAEVRATLYWPESYPLHNDLDLYLADPAGNIVASSDSSANTDEIISFPNPSPAGNWKLLVTGFSVHGTQQYALATNLNASRQFYYSSGNLSTNAFHYINVTSPNATLFIDVSFNNSAALGFYLYNSSGSLLYSSALANSTNYSLSIPLNSTGLYLLMLGAGSNASYSLASNYSISPVFLDAASPSVSISSPQNATYLSGSLSLSFTAIDAVSAMLSCNQTIDSVLTPIASTVQNASLVSVALSLTAGLHSAGVSCSDFAGNTASPAATVFFVGSQQISLNLTSPANNSLLNSSNVSFAANASRMAVWLNYSLDGGAPQNACLLCSGFAGFLNVSEGLHNLSASASGAFDGAFAAATSFFTVDSTPPVIYSVSPSNASFSTGGSATQFSVSYNEPNLQGVILYYRQNLSAGYLNASPAGCASGNSSCIALVNLSGFGEGAVYFYLQLNDSANHSASSATRLLSIDRSPPQLLASSLSPALPSYSDGMTFSGNWSDASGISAVLLESNHSGAFANYSAVLQSGNYSFSFGPASLAAGTVVQWRFLANDSLGNLNNSLGYSVFTVAKSASNATLYFNGGLGTSFTSGDLVNITCVSNASDALVELFANFSGIYSSIANGSGVANYSLNSTGLSGAFNITAVSSSAANYSNSSATAIVFFNSTASVSSLPTSSPSPSPAPLPAASGGGGGGSGGSGGGSSGGGGGGGSSASGGAASSASVGDSSGGNSAGHSAGSGGGTSSPGEWLSLSGLPSSFSARPGESIVLKGVLRNTVPSVVYGARLLVSSPAAGFVASKADLGIVSGFGELPFEFTIRIPASASGTVVLSLSAAGSVLGTAYEARSKPFEVSVNSGVNPSALPPLTASPSARASVAVPKPSTPPGLPLSNHPLAQSPAARQGSSIVGGAIAGQPALVVGASALALLAAAWFYFTRASAQTRPRNRVR